MCVCGKDTSEFIKLDQNEATESNASAAAARATATHSTFQWNSEPTSVIIFFPYVFGFADQSIEIRLLVNGSLVNSLTMSNVKLISSKV